MNKEIIKLSPAFKDYLWGGTRLREEYNKKCDFDKIAESWELSTHPDGESVVSSGFFSGMVFSEYLKNNPGAKGNNAERFEFFPILIKFIDAKDNLSIQVHPDDEYARKKNGGYGKTEMWYILDAEPGAYLYYGFKEKISKDEFRQRIEDNSLLDVLNKEPVKKGDVFFIPSGTVHAIGKGIMICEIQQNSNTTYRVYDYGRRDKNGNLRELHIDEALDVAKTEPPVYHKPENENVLASCRYFTVEKADISGEKSFESDISSFRSVIITEGEGQISLNGQTMPFIKGDSLFIPAQNARFSIKGTCSVIISYV